MRATSCKAVGETISWIYRDYGDPFLNQCGSQMAKYAAFKAKGLCAFPLSDDDFPHLCVMPVTHEIDLKSNNDPERPLIAYPQRLCERHMKFVTKRHPEEWKIKALG